MIMLLLTILAIFLGPGNTFLFMAMLMFAPPHLYRKLEWPQKFFICWIVSSLFSCLLSEAPMVAFFGCASRMEGWLMWLVVARIAYVYWTYESDLGVLMMTLFAMEILIGGFGLYLKDMPMSAITISGISAMAIPIIWSIRPWCSLLFLPVLLWPNNRSAVMAAVASVGIYCLMMGLIKIQWKKAAICLALLCITLMAVPATRHKIMGFDPSTVGGGARTQWTLQAQQLVNRRPFFGVGLDMLSGYLSNPVCLQHPNFVADRTHSVIMDTLSMTGWIGYFFLTMSFSACVATAIKYRSQVNCACLAGIAAWIIMGMFNPQGITAHVMMAICIFGIRKDSDDV